MKVKNFDNFKRTSQRINVESPRFIETMRRAIEEMFAKNGKEMISYEEFRNSFKKLSYELSDNDVNMLIALADEEPNEKIDWKKFIPLSLKTIKIFYQRNPIESGDLKKVYEKEIKICYKMLRRKFGNEETISLEKFKGIIRSCKHLTPKEQNLLIRLQSSQTIRHCELPKMLYEVRYELAINQLMSTLLLKDVSQLTDSML